MKGNPLNIIAALRQLLWGIKIHPWIKDDPSETKRPPKDISEIAALEIQEIKRKLEQDQDQDIWALDY